MKVFEILPLAQEAMTIPGCTLLNRIYLLEQTESDSPLVAKVNSSRETKSSALCSVLCSQDSHDGPKVYLFLLQGIPGESLAVPTTKVLYKMPLNDLGRYVPIYVHTYILTYTYADSATAGPLF